MQTDRCFQDYVRDLKSKIEIEFLIASNHAIIDFMPNLSSLCAAQMAQTSIPPIDHSSYGP